MAEADQNAFEHETHETHEAYEALETNETHEAYEALETSETHEAYVVPELPESRDNNVVDNSQLQLTEETPTEQKQEQQQLAEDTVLGGGEKKWPGWPGESVFRMLVPAQKVGSIIGRKGEFIKKLVEETRARIKILDGPPGTAERAVMVSGKEEPDSSLPPAIDGLLRVHKRIVDGLDGDSHAALAVGAKVSTKLLVPASQAGNLIGKQGGTVKSIQEASNCIVRILGTGYLQ